MTQDVLIAGAGIGGLASALALSQAGVSVKVLEQAAAFADVGAGIQLGPNAVRLLDGWGLATSLRQVAATPERLQVRDARDGQTLGTLRLGATFRERYRHPYLTVHRADLHHLLLDAAQSLGVVVQHGVAIKDIAQDADGIRAVCQKSLESGENFMARALIGCDGLWSTVRQHLLHDGPPRLTGHLAYRALLPVGLLPPAVSAQQVSVWLGARLHAVCYPVRGGSAMNLVLVVHGSVPQAAVATEGGSRSWTHAAGVHDLLAALPGAHHSLLDLVGAASDCTFWALHDRPPLLTARSYARGRVALLGDAAHPMRPYLAQGAAMALEDAAALADAWRRSAGDVPLAWQRYARARWLRNARVQWKARANGVLFHARGPLRLARNAVMHWRGEAVLDTPWLYGSDRLHDSL